MPYEMLTGEKRPSGFQKAWPEVIACWKHETGNWLCLQRFGHAVSLAWRIRPTYAVWPHDVLILDETDDIKTNTMNAISQAEALLALGPGPNVTDAKATAKVNDRVRQRTRYAKKKAKQGPTKRDLNREAREALAHVIGGAAGKALLENYIEGESATPAAPARKSGRPRIEDVEKAAKASEAKGQRIRDLVAPHAMRAGIPADDVENYRTRGASGKGGKYVVTAWLGTDAGKAALLEASTQADAEFGAA